MTLTTAVRRSVVAAGLALAVLAGPALAPPALAAPATQGPSGELEDLFSGQCVPELTPTVPGSTLGQQHQVPMVGQSDAPCDGQDSEQCVPGPQFGQPHQVVMPGQTGVPCDGENTAECVPGGEANTGTSIWVPQVAPESKVEASP